MTSGLSDGFQLTNEGIILLKVKLKASDFL